MSTVPTIELNDGRPIPQLGLGVFQIEPGETAEAVARALDAGYRHVDTAQMYENEKEVGEAVKASALDRADVFLTSKLSNASHRPDDARRSFDETLSKLGSDYVDLFLIHWPLPMLYDGDFVAYLEDARGPPPGRTRALDRRLQLRGRPPRAARDRVRGRARRQPDRAAPVLPQ
jgi:2,5-diketo-D-gluconate reductase A